MASIEMKNLRSFPMEKLCFDLKLEALEEMDTKDVLELIKVNQGFQGMLVRDPSIVFGAHVYGIQFDDEKIWIMKFSNSNAMELNVDRFFFHFSFVRKIRSCDKLWLGSDSIEVLERFFSNFHASIKKTAGLDIYDSAFNDQVIKDRMEDFMVGPQLKDCERIRFNCCSEDSVHFCYNALLKSEFKNVAMHTYPSRFIGLIIQQIMTNGIPSKNPEATIFLYSDKSYFTIDLSQYPGMRRIDGENSFRLLKQANDLVKNLGYSGSGVFRKESSMFRRGFDSTKDCICVYDKRYTGCFLTFYVPID